MASGKRKSIGSRPTAQYDTWRFRSLDAWNRYTNNVLGRNILPERKVELYHTEFDDFKTELERRNLHKCLTNLVDGSIDVALVKEFYANLYSSEGPSPKQARVRGHLVKIDVDSLNTFLETPVVLEEGETLPIYSRYCRLPSDPREIKATLCIPGRGFILNVEGHPGRILAQVWSVLSYSNLAATSHTSDLIMDRARLIFGLVSRMDMNIEALIFGQMTSIAQSNSSRLGFLALITTLCRARGVVSDSLTFEHLSPVINLAYFRKNCWNPDDLTVVIRGARRARPRPVDLPSTSAVPTPGSTSAAPSVVAPPGSIPSIEQFLERVAWPGAQPSLHREDEGPTTQEVAATSERSREVTSDPPIPVVDLSSPQHAIDPSTPILEIPEDLTTPVLTLNTSPPATPVLHLTDEEDVQTQDTQDQLIRQVCEVLIFILSLSQSSGLMSHPLSAILLD
ncbi:hypothetical protein GmHk_05G013046 [Glycine max]|nr:hypothetical protein GmHk_05G013046 [Glycine max]